MRSAKRAESGNAMETMIARVNAAHAREDWSALDDLSHRVIEETLRIQRIAAPTFHEARRARAVLERFNALPLVDVEIDEINNVYSRLKGRTSAAALLVMAHTDTVFPADADLSIRRDAGKIYGPGIGDNSLGVAALLGLARSLSQSAPAPACDIWFVADSCEEGLGDLRGAKAAFAKLQSRINAVINLEGLALGHIYNAGTAVYRMRIGASAAGGHSWLHYGKPSALHGILQLGNQILELKLPRSPRTTMNIGMIDGGQAINAIATEASLWLDLRSVSPDILRDLRERVSSLVDGAQTEGLSFTMETVGDRPAGSIPRDHELVQGALAALDCVGIRGALETGSTDANAPLAHGCPAVTIGITRGGNAHRLDEFIETKPVKLGLQQLITLALAAAEHYAASARQAS